jgi:type II secretion system protein I
MFIFQNNLTLLGVGYNSAIRIFIDYRYLPFIFQKSQGCFLCALCGPVRDYSQVKAMHYFRTGDRITVTSKQQTGVDNRQTASGFTLLEVMVAMAIMAIVLVSVYRMQSQTLTMNTAARFYTQAPMLAQSKLAQLEAASAGTIVGDSGDFGDKFPGYSWSISTDEVSSENSG